MKKFFVFLLIGITVSLWSQSFEEDMQAFSANQKKISSFIGTGSTTIQIKNSKGQVMNQMTSNLSIWMKQPDLFKLVIKSSSNDETAIVQKGDLVSQKMAGMDNVITKKADNNVNIASQFFLSNITESFKGAEIIDVNVYDKDNQTFTVYKMKPGDLSHLNSTLGNIEYLEVVFNEKHLIVKNSLVSDGKSVLETQMTYTEKSDIYVIQKIEIKTDIQSSFINETIIEYKGITINSNISDQEFEL